jgi:predicted transport protein
MPNFVQLKTISLKDHPTLNERWVQERIVENPMILGLGNVDVKESERIQPHAGRLDLLLEDAEWDPRIRYEVELQLGATDESHIIRCIEYWDNERKRMRKYAHCAVLVAEDVTSRFFNVIGLFNGAIPIIAIQMKAIETSDGVGLVFTKILDLFESGFVDDEDELNEPTDRKYWEQKGSPDTVKLADNLLSIVHKFDDGFELNYNKHYIGLKKGSHSINFITAKPRKKSIELGVKLDRTDEWDKLIEKSGLDTLAYSRSGKYRFRLTGEDIEKGRPFLEGLIENSYKNRISQSA